MEDISGGTKGNTRAFGDPGKEKPIATRDMDTFTTQILDPEDDQEDEELRRWELNQIKKGGGGSFSETLAKDLKLALDSMSEVASTHMSELAKVESALRDAQAKVQQLEADRHVTEDELAFFGDFDEYVGNMTGCLEEKIPLVESYEERLMDLERDHAGALRKQIKDANEDEAVIVYEARKSKMSMTTATTNTEDLDEFGRDRSYFEKEARERRIIQIKARQEDQEDLMDETEEQYYQQERQKILDITSKVLEDVDEEYSDLKMIRDRFQHWKAKDYKSYTRIHLGHMMPALFAPFIRLQLIDWSPLSTMKFDSYPWYSDLSDYEKLNPQYSVKFLEKTLDTIQYLKPYIVGTKLPYLINITAESMRAFITPALRQKLLDWS
eukprot:gene11241-13120_t